MTFASRDSLSARQVELLDDWLPGAAVVRDHGWGLVATTVLEVVRGADHLIVKAGGERDGHIAREITAHRKWLSPWVARGRAPELLHCDVNAKLVVTRYLPGRLVLGDASADEPDTYRQAGELLAAFHGQESRVDAGHERTENARALAWLDEPHRIDVVTCRRLRDEIASWPEPAAPVVPTHGDWQPRNWLVADGVVSVIDFGRAALRSPTSPGSPRRTSAGTRPSSRRSSTATAPTLASRAPGSGNGCVRLSARPRGRMPSGTRRSRRRDTA